MKKYYDVKALSNRTLTIILSDRKYDKRVALNNRKKAI